MSDQTIIGAHGDFDPRDLKFIRSMKEGRFPDMELETTEPLEPLWKTTVAAILLAIFIGALIGFMP